MRVRLKTDAQIPANDSQRFAAWIEPGKEYVVLEVTGSSLLRLNDDPEIGGLWEVRHFEVTDTAIPPSWTISLDSEGRIKLSPRRWLEPDFWDALFDDEPGESMTWAERTQRFREARVVYDEEVDRIVASS